jgi:reactive intermediate/imine deaminase
MSRSIISTAGTPSTVGPFSPGVRADNSLIFFSGQVGLDPATGTLADGITAQTRQALQNLTVIVEAAGKTLEDVVRVGIYLTDMKDYTAMNQAYLESFAAPYPARTAIQVAGLPLGAAVEIDAIVG